MFFRKSCFYSIYAIIMASFVISCAHADLCSEINAKTKEFQDVTLTGKVLYANVTQLRRISKDFHRSYEFKTTTIKYKAPDKLKMEGKLGMVKGAIIINGDWKVTRFIIAQKDNLKEDPHKRQTDLDIGIITDSLWRDYKILNTDYEKTPDGTVNRISFVRENAKDKKLICWIDAKNAKLLKVEKYEDDGRLKSRYVYSDHKFVDCIWVPTRIDVYNGEGKLAGTTSYENIKVNTGIPDSEFKL